MKKEYPEFDEWFTKISREGRECWVHYNSSNQIGALLIYKIEDEPIDSIPPLPKRKRVKISTFKVEHQGQKIGELFIRLSVDIAVSNNISEVYLTHFVGPDDRLIDLISQYGFKKVSQYKSGEHIFVKELLTTSYDIVNLSPVEIAKIFFPSFYDGEKVNKFIIPIRPIFHNRLFTNYDGRQISISEHLGDFIVEGNTIKKAYICNSRIKKIKEGDILLFYVSGQSRLTSIGITEAVYYDVQNPDEIMELVGRRTVYSLNELKELALKPTLILLFLHNFHLSIPLSLYHLKDMGVLKSAPQSIIEISNEGYLKIKEKGGIDERFTVN